jgi:hypothetical protein
VFETSPDESHGSYTLIDRYGVALREIIVHHMVICFVYDYMFCYMVVCFVVWLYVLLCGCMFCCVVVCFVMWLYVLLCGCMFCYVVVCFVCFYLILYILFSYCYVYVFLLLCMFHSRYYVLLCCSVYCLCVNVYCTTATGCQPICSKQIYQYEILSISVNLVRVCKEVTVS